MRLNYKKLGEYIELVGCLNADLHYGEVDVRGVSNSKEIIQTKANNEGRDFNKFYVVAPNEFIYNSRTSRMGEKVGLGYNDTEKTFITSFNNTVFRVRNEALLPMYLFMWFNRPEFDRYARFHSWGSSTEIFSWTEMRNTLLPIPCITKQREIVKEYNTVVTRIKLNQQLIQKLEETAQVIYKQWFVDFEFPDENGNPYKSSSGEMEFNEELDKEIPKGWKVGKLPDLIEVKYGKAYSHLLAGDIPLYGSGGLMSKVNKALYTKPSVLIPRKGTLNNIMFVNQPFWCVDTMFYSIFNNEVNGYYAYYILKQLDFEALNQGSAVPSMTTAFLNDIEVVIPSQYILGNFNEALKKIITHKENLEKENQKLSELKDLLLSKLATIEN